MSATSQRSRRGDPSWATRQAAHRAALAPRVEAAVDAWRMASYSGTVRCFIWYRESTATDYGDVTVAASAPGTEWRLAEPTVLSLWTSGAQLRQRLWRLVERLPMYPPSAD